MNKRISATVGWLNFWNAMTRLCGEPSPTAEPQPWRAARLRVLFSDREAARREAFLDTVPGVMHEPESRR